MSQVFSGEIALITRQSLRHSTVILSPDFVGVNSAKNPCGERSRTIRVEMPFDKLRASFCPDWVGAQHDKRRDAEPGGTRRRDAE